MTEQPKKKSGCLTAFLIFLIVIYALVGLGYFIAAPLVEGYIPGYNTSYGIITGILNLVNIVFLIAIWKLKKWGFYGYLGITVVSIIITLYIGGDILSALMALIYPIILYILIRPIWNNMD